MLTCNPARPNRPTRLLESIPPTTHLVVFDTDFEDAKYHYKQLGSHVHLYKPDKTHGEELGYLNDFLKVMMTKLGEITITQADETSSTGTYSGSAPPAVGDAAQSAQ